MIDLTINKYVKVKFIKLVLFNIMYLLLKILANENKMRYKIKVCTKLM